MRESRGHEITLVTQDVEDEYQSRLNEELNASRARLESQFASRAKVYTLLWGKTHCKAVSLQSDHDHIADLQRRYKEANNERSRLQTEADELRSSLTRANAELDGRLLFR